MRTFDQGTFVPSTAQTVGPYLKQWLDKTVKPTVRPATHRSYSHLVTFHITPTLGAVRLQRLSPQQVQEFLNGKLADGLSPRTVQYILAVFRRALGQALKWGLVAKNVASLVDAPRVEHHEIRPLDVKEAKKLLKALKGHRLEALYTVSLALGLRQGEVLGLRWQDIEFKKRQLRVQVALQRLGREYRLAEPKTQKGKRTLDLPERVVAALRRRRLIQQKERLTAGSKWQEHWGLVFTTRGGRPLEGPRITRDFKRILKAEGLPAQRFHDLRHACASFLIAQGVQPRVVMEVLGHSQISITMNTYAHVMPTLKQEAATQMNKILG